MCLTLCLGFGPEKGSVYLVGMPRETRGVVVYGGVVLVGRVVVNGGGGLEDFGLYSRNILQFMPFPHLDRL